MVLCSYFEVVYEYFDDDLREGIDIAKMNWECLFAVSLHESGDHVGECGKVGGAEVCLSMFNLYEYFNYLDLDLGSYISIFDHRSSKW